MQQLLLLILFLCTITIYSQNSQSSLSSSYKTIELSEVVVTNETLYNIYQKAVSNLKKKLIKNTEITYRIDGKETETIKGEERSLEVLFTAKLEKVTPKKDKLNYKLMLSYMKHTPDILGSEIMKHSRYCISLFFDNIPSEIKQSELNIIKTDDSFLYVYDNSEDKNVNILYTICKEDTTLIGIDINYKGGKRSSRPTSISERLSGKIVVQYKKSDEGYYLSSLNQSGSRYFKFRKSEREERISLNYVVKALPDTTIITYTEFKPSTYKIFHQPNTIQ